MSETKTKPVLTEKQIAWANAFLRAMGGKGNVQATIAPKPVVTKGSKTPPPEDLKGDLGTLETTAKQGLQEARDQLVGKDEDVSRKKFIGKSIDKGYTDRVTTEVNKIIDAVDKLISSGKEMDDNIRETLLTLHDKLGEGQAHYRDAITGDKKDVKLDKQRQDKVDAIGERMEAITRLMSESTRTQFRREDEVTKLNPKERAKMLKANPEMLKAVISAKPAPAELADVLSEMGDSADGMIKQIIAAHGTDTAYMELLCDKTVGNDLKGASAGGNLEGTFFRGNSTATKLTKAYAMTGETPAFLKGIDTDAKEWLGDVSPETPIEIDPDKNDNQEVIDKSVLALVAFCEKTLHTLESKPAPSEIATTASMIAAAAGKAGMDGKKVAIMVGGHVFLRVIVPALVAMPSISAPQRRAMTLATKILQNISNGMRDGSKEAYMAPFAQMVDDEMPALHKWFMDIVAQGDELRGINGLDDDVTKGVSRRDVLVMNLEDPSHDLDQYFARPTAEDPLGRLPEDPTTRIGKFVLDAGATRLPPDGITLPDGPNSSHDKLVKRERGLLIKLVVDRLKSESPKKDED